MATPIRENQPILPGDGPVDCERAFAEHRSWLRSIVLARLGETQAAEEVLQEVALAVIANRAPLADPEKLAPWLYQIAVRQSLLYRRKHGRRRKLIDRYAERYQPTDEDNRTLSPLDWLLAEERAELFRQAMEQLSERDREVLLLKYDHGWSYRKISQQLGLSESAVEARLHRARHRLRHRLVQLNAVGN
jgi:RNA polymerase sigma-70 factor (ECF subfamily)